MEIQDKSKGDFISKAVVILQTSWFVMQCIARGVKGVPITELELVTVAFAGLNFVIYLLWWDKPLNVQCGVRVYKKRPTRYPVDDGDAEAAIGFWGAIGGAISELPTTIIRGPSFQDWTLDELPWLARVLVWPGMKPFIILLGGGDDKVGEKRVGTFYPLEWEQETEASAWYLLIIIALAFGSVHCIGWSFVFPSSTERTLWRLASVFITSFPIALFLSLYPAVLISCCVEDLPTFVEMFFPSLQLFLYILSRLVLLILAVLSLRSLPPETYHIVHWTSFIPHI